VDLSFYKLRVCDADLLLVDDLAGDGRDRDWEEAARALLHRRRGAGADRLAVVSRAEEDIWLRVFVPGGEGGPCADAALCAARYLLDSGRSGSETVRLRVSRDAAASGEVEVDVLDSASLGLAVGPPRSVLAGPRGGEQDAALAPEEVAALSTLIEAGGARYEVIPIRAGLPGTDAAAIFAEGAAARARARIRASGGPSRGAAVAVRVVSRGELRASAPASPEIDSIAAAACALAAAAAAGRSDREALVRLRAGALWVEWAPRGSLYAVGRPEYVYRGEFHLPDR